MTLHLNKPALRVLGIAESFSRSRPYSMIAGVVMRADLRVDGLAYCRAMVGGDDATAAILQIFRGLDRPDINALLISGAVVSWFNIIDLHEVHAKTGRPVVCLTYDDSEGLEGYIREYFPDAEDKIAAYRRLGERQTVCLKTGYEVFVRTLGASLDEARLLLNKFIRDGRTAEPIRLAKLAARAAQEAEFGKAGTKIKP
ncbi:MAG TPA: DUF99 family protein [Methanothrix sp.]|nr:DUF99 family protein [Methanothrix sp.]